MPAMITKRKSVKDQIKVKMNVLRTAQRRAAQLQVISGLSPNKILPTILT
jgi:hypothetical protein